MSGLPSGQFLDYLVIGVLGAAAITVFGALLHGAIKKPIWKIVAIVAMPALVALAVFGHFAVQKLVPPEPPAHVLIDPSPTPFATATPIPKEDPAAALQPTPSPIQHDVAKENYVGPFITQNIASPGKGLRRNGQWAVLIAEPGKQTNYPRLANAASEAITAAGHTTVTLFRPFAAHTTEFATLYSADPVLSRRLHEYCDQILLGKVTSDVQQNPISPGLLKLTLTIDIKIISTNTGDVQRQIQASAIGAGYEVREAHTNAEKSLADSLKTELQAVISH